MAQAEVRSALREQSVFGAASPSSSRAEKPDPFHKVDARSRAQQPRGPELAPRMASSPFATPDRQIANDDFGNFEAPRGGKLNIEEGRWVVRLENDDYSYVDLAHLKGWGENEPRESI